LAQVLKSSIETLVWQREEKYSLECQIRENASHF